MKKYSGNSRVYCFPKESGEKKKQGTTNNSNPVLVVMKGSKDSDEADRATLEIIGKCIVNPLKKRVFDCLFLSNDEKTAIELQKSLSQNHNYKITKSYKDDDGWITNAIKKMLHADLETSLDQAKKEAAKHSSRLFDWNFEADHRP